MEIRPVDVHDDAQLHAMFVAEDASRREGREHLPLWSEREMVTMLRVSEPAELTVPFVAVEDEAVVGTMTLWLPQHDNLTFAGVDVHVPPEHRRRGVARALVAHFETLAAEAGRTQLLSSSRIPFEHREDHPYRAAAGALGYAEANIEIVRNQAVPVPDADLDAWAAHAAEMAGGYELHTYVDEFPADLAPSLALLLGQLAVDAPTGDLEFEEEAYDAERIARRTERIKAMGRQGFETVAVKDGVVAAQSTLAVPLEGPDAFQWGTFVHREHRGHRLGLAVKVANLRAAQAAHPHLRRINTQNAEVNRWMIAVNELMGYEPVEVFVEWVKRTS